jgi:hypothetical protein
MNYPLKFMIIWNWVFEPSLVKLGMVIISTAWLPFGGNFMSGK